MVSRASVVLVLVVAGMLPMPTVSAEPSIATDDRGFIDTAARCEKPAIAVAFGRTERSLVAICAEAGQFEYRGVRLRDDAKLVIPAERSDGAGFVADNDGVTYLVTATSLVISVGDRVIRDEPMVEFQEPGAPESIPSPTPTTPPLPAEVGGSGP
jgi:hypothetical protein